jgi:alcohol dehydrogenase class IV
MFNKNIHQFPIVYTNPLPKIALGWGSYETIADECKSNGIKKALIVSSGLKETGIIDEVKGVLTNGGISFDLFDEITSNPKDHQIMKAYEFFKESECDGIVAVGGGTSIDTGKCIRVIDANGGKHVNNFVAKLDPPWMETLAKLNPCTIPQISVATTAGTGAEVTSWAAISNTEDRAKVLVGAPNIHSTVAIVDPLFARLQPKNVAAWTGFDAMAHAVEAYVTKVTGPYSHGILLRAFELIYKNLRKFTFNRMDNEACEKMCWATTMGGIGIAFGAGAGIVHGLGHQISAITDCHHGHINGVLMLAGERYNQPAAIDKFADMTQAMGIDTMGMSQMEMAERWFIEMEQLIHDVEIRSGYLTEQFGITEKDFDHIIEIYENDFCSQGNPKEFNAQEVKDILKSVLDAPY